MALPPDEEFIYNLESGAFGTTGLTGADVMWATQMWGQDFSCPALSIEAPIHSTKRSSTSKKPKGASTTISTWDTTVESTDPAVSGRGTCHELPGDDPANTSYGGSSIGTPSNATSHNPLDWWDEESVTNVPKGSCL